MRIQIQKAQVGNRNGSTFLGGTADEGGVDVDAYAPQPVNNVRGGPVDAPYREPTFTIVVFHDRATVRAGQLDGVHGDRRQHAIDVQAGAHCLPDHAQRLQLTDLSGKLCAARLKLLDELDAIDCHRCLSGECGHDRPLAFAEGTHFVAPDRHRPDDLIVDDQWGAHGGAEASDTLKIEPAVTRIGDDVRICCVLRSNPTRPINVSRSIRK